MKQNVERLSEVRSNTYISLITLKKNEKFKTSRKWDVLLF